MTSKTIALSGAEIRVSYGGGTNVWLRNDGTATVYASTAPGVTAGADGTVSIPAGQAAAIYGACGAVYLLGTGSVQLVGSEGATPHALLRRPHRQAARAVWTRWQEPP